MENHPIPQDVTGFQFKLVGNMTLKQFGYVAAGVILTAVFWYAPIAWYIKTPLVIFFALSGVSLAFLPIDGRAMDVMVMNFLKAFLKNDEYIYKKNGGKLSFSDLQLRTPAQTQQMPTQQTVTKKQSSVAPQKEQQLRALLDDLSLEQSTSIDQQEEKYLHILPTPQPVAQQSHSPLSFIHPIPLSQHNQQTPPLPAQISQSMPVSQQVISQPAPLPVQPVTPPPLTQPQPPAATVKPVATPLAKPAAPVMPKGMDFPNLVRGIVKDSRGNVLQGILLDVKNSSGDSVRAFKTNALGQFASATQLALGSYTIHFEDPKKQHSFEPIPIDVNGTILTPLEVTSTDAREELRKQLFG